MRVLILSLLLGWSMSPLAGDRHESEACPTDRLLVSMIPKKDIDEQIAEYRPLVSLIRDRLGMPVDMVRASSYQSVMDALASGAVDMAVLGPAAYVMTHRRNPGIEAFASLTVAPGTFTPAGSYYRALLLVPQDSDAHAPADLENGVVALTDPSSTSGNLVPRSQFAAQIGQPFESFFAGQLYAGSHDKALDALLAGDVDGAFVSSSRADEYVARGVMASDRLRPLWRSSPLHYDPFVFRSGLCPALKTAIRHLMLSPSPRRQRFLESQQATGITPVTHRDYRPLATLLQ